MANNHETKAGTGPARARRKWLARYRHRRAARRKKRITRVNEMLMVCVIFTFNEMAAAAHGENQPSWQASIVVI